MHAGRTSEANGTRPAQHGAIAIQILQAGNGANKAQRQNPGATRGNQPKALGQIQRIGRRFSTQIGRQILAPHAQRHNARISTRNRVRMAQGSRIFDQHDEF